MDILLPFFETALLPFQANYLESKKIFLNENCGMILANYQSKDI
jgi:hypothetical protein